MHACGTNVSNLPWNPRLPHTAVRGTLFAFARNIPALSLISPRCSSKTTQHWLCFSDQHPRAIDLHTQRPTHATHVSPTMPFAKLGAKVIYYVSMQPSGGGSPSSPVTIVLMHGLGSSSS